MARQGSQQPLNSASAARTRTTLAVTAAKGGGDAAASTPAGAPKNRQIHKAGEVNISAYFPAEVKASLRIVQAKTGNNVKDCLAEALRDLFRKYNVPGSIELGEGR